MKIPYLDLRVTDPDLKAGLLKAVETVFDHGRVVLGPEVETLEKRLAGFCRRKYAVGVSSGTDALYLALCALDIGAGDEVITTPLSWIATVNAIVMTGATPVFTDIGEDLNMDPERIDAVVTDRTKGIVPVHFTGKICDMASIQKIARSHGIYVVEDSAQAFGAAIDGQPAGSFGHVACLSMNAMKVLHSYGEAGAVLMDSEPLKKKVESLRYAGTVNREDCHYPSLNFRIHTLQAALLLVELKRVEKIIRQRNEIARFYESRLKNAVICPEAPANHQHVYYTYTIQAESRDRLREHLGQRGIETKIHHPILMPDHSAYRGRFRADISNARRLHGKILSIPNHEKMTDEQTDFVASSIKAFYGIKPA